MKLTRRVQFPVGVDEGSSLKKRQLGFGDDTNGGLCDGCFRSFYDGRLGFCGGETPASLLLLREFLLKTLLTEPKLVSSPVGFVVSLQALD